MYADYEKLVLEDYRRKKSQTLLSPTLMNPTPAKLKKGCARLCSSEIQNKDVKVIREFCEEWDNTRSCLQNIHRCAVDKFKPLSNFLRGNTESTDFKNIQLLAWLIDFPHRPFVLGKVVSITETQAGVEAPELSQVTIVDVPPVPEDSPTIATEVKNTDTEDQAGAEQSDASTNAKGNIVSTKDVEQVRPKRRFRKIAMVGVLLAVTGTSGYLLRNTTQQGNGTCMYWAKDHFQPTPCNQPIPHTLVIALDTARVKNFKKITHPDTITNRAKGSVWYSKIDNEVEFFTAGGEHPVVIGRRLKPITDYIIGKYIHPGMSSDR